MAWRSNTKPTAANIRKRIDAAILAIEAADVLLAAHGSLSPAVSKELGHARAWALSARRRTERPAPRSRAKGAG